MRRPDPRAQSAPAAAPAATPARPAALAALLAAGALGVGLALALAGCGGSAAGSPAGPRVIVLGFDGMDHALARRLMDEGRMPTFSRLAREGSFAPLGTSVPPQSPVAWSNFITGMDSGGHGIFDFIHRDPATMIPYLSSSRLEPGGKILRLGRYCLPLESGEAVLLRRGTPFWEVLEEAGVETTVIRMPANFPPSGTATRELSGMGTPDLLGTYGFFSFFTSELFAFAGQEIGGGEVYEIFVEDGLAEATLVGPPNPYLCDPEPVTLDFSIWVDPDAPRVKIEIGGEERVLEEGEWSDWVPVEFDLVPTQSLRGICRFYLRQVRPELELYASPINYDPLDPAVPISTPASYATELARATGRFFTQGMPEDQRALREGVFDRDDFIAQAKIAGDEVVHQYRWVLDRFDRGLLFYYFGNLDMISHMLWRPLDPDHPAYDPVADPPYADVIPDLYAQFDAIVGYTLEHMPPETLLVVMSDHGFTSARRKFHLNAWLAANGYLRPHDPGLRNDPGGFANVDWSGTRAYALGLNSLYVNLAGREKHGIVEPAARAALLDEISAELLATIDPATGSPAVTKVYRLDEYFRHRDALDIGPDLVIGYAKGTIAADGSSLGGTSTQVFSDNVNPWTGDHLMDHEAVPGILLTNRPLSRAAPRLEDLAAAILAELGVGEGFPPR